MTEASRSARRGPTRLLVVAAAGYGKTTALEAALGDGDSCHQADDLLRSLAVLPPGDRLYVDHLERLSIPQQEDLMRGLARLGPDVQLTVASGSPLPASVRALMPGPVFERGPEDLALSPEGVAGVLRDEHGVDGASWASRVHAITGGWAALVQFAGDALSRGHGGDLLTTLSEPGSATATWLEAEVLASAPEEVGSALAAASGLDVLDPGLLSLLLPSGSADAWCWLRRSGLLGSRPARRRGAQTLALVPVVAAVVSARAGTPRHDQLVTAADWYAAHDQPLPAARTLLRAGLESEARALVVERGEEMLAAGEAAGVVQVLRTGASEARTSTDQLLFAEALRMTGDAPAALRAFAPQVTEAERTGVWPASLGARVARVHYMLADYRAALRVLDQATPDHNRLDRDCVGLLACRADVLSMLGREDDAVAVAAAAVAAADRLGDDRATAAARLAAANTSTGTTKEAHLARALAAADRAGDVVQTARVLLNQAYGLLAAARYDEAHDVARQAVRAAERGSPPGLLVVALHNLGEALRRVGRHPEAELHLQRSVALSLELGLNRTAFGLWGLAEIHRDQGRREQSIIGYEAAIETARGTGEVQVLVPALAGLARARAQCRDELVQARLAATEAARLACPEFAPYALLACGWVALAGGDREAAARHGAAALAAARSSACIDALAEALELAAQLDDDPREARAALEEALGIWVAGGAEPSADRIRVLLARLADADGPARSEGRDAARRLVRRGLRAVNGHRLDRAEGAAAVGLRLLGGFEVLVGGQPVPVPTWRSKQARTLVKILAARRGRVVTRSEVCELLWPDDEPSKTGHRLSVLLSAVRGVLDPERTWPPDHFIRADLSGLALDLGHVSVDVERLLQDAAHAEDLLRAGDHERAAEILTAVDAAYTGDALEDEPYADWADGLREEARAASLRSLRNLAVLRHRAAQHEAAAGLLLRLLVADPYDEPAHRGLVQALVRAGRHGEARRAFARWRAAMRSIEAPEPDPQVLQPGHSRPPSTSPVLTVAS